ncbi:hypothetical protein OS188_12805 [Xanthomarina sp. F1114]|uniref:hypothetical protein n=1 Tax=Xanthomarina sp. F1114 TaxID=2996019 RepID=UPI00225E1F19|nr:hypothetical protein [Xanthomarina sp. F1114]MCX7548834.1 hypothetical protein [Xanthomarina sp. F1114]
MSDKKHIDRVFQEKFKDFEATPNSEVWNKIQSKLNKPEKDRKRVIPLWFKIAGVAALLLLLLTVGGILISDNFLGNTNKIKVVDTENPTKDNTNTSTESSTNSNVVTTPDKNKITDNAIISETGTDNKLSKQKKGLNSTQIASEESQSKKSIYPINNKTSKKKSINKNIRSTSEEPHINNTQIANNTNSRDKTDSNKHLKENPSKINTDIPSRNNIADNTTKSESGKADSHLEVDQNKTENQIQQLNINTTEHRVALEENTKAETENLLEEELNKTDLTIEEAIAANQDIIEEEKDEIINRWQVYANMAPVYYNSMGKGSHINEQFKNNSKSGEVNTSYGVNVSYNLNKKLSIRTGLSSLNLSYDTNDVILYQGMSNTGATSSALRNIDLSKGNESLSAISADNLKVGEVDNLLSPNSNAAISQRISYYEIPMELNYRVGSKKFGINLIAGFSSFILDGNDVYSELLGEKKYIGEANNINSVSFSTNLGVGLDYKFTEKFKFNLEPTLKYQLNAFENTSGNFNPYIIGVYTGFSYKF